MKKAENKEQEIVSKETLRKITEINDDFNVNYKKTFGSEKPVKLGGTKVW